MKWSDIRTNVKESVRKVAEMPHQVRESEDLPVQGVAQEKQRRFMIIFGIFLVIIISAGVLYMLLSNRESDQSFINQEQAQIVDEFLTENPPVPVTEDQESFMADLLLSDFPTE